MNTNNRWMKALSVFIILTFFLQGIPAYALPPADDVDATGVSVPRVPAGRTAYRPAEREEMKKDPTAEFLNPVALSVDKPNVRPAYRPPSAEPAQIALVKNDLMNTFGFSEAQLNELIKKGLIRFKFDRTPYDVKVFRPRGLTVLIDPSVELPAGAINLTDPLGSNDVPDQINYQFESLIPKLCTQGAVCTSTYQLVSAHFINDKGQSVEVTYQNNQIAHVEIYDLKTACNADDCVSQKILVKEIQYSEDISYIQQINNLGGDPENVEYVQMIDRKRTARIIYYDGSQGDVASRMVIFDQNGDIKEVTEFDKDGKVIAVNKFYYSAARCTPNARNCAADGISIQRTDADGNLLSTVDLDFFVNGRTLMTVMLPYGKVVRRGFRHPPTLERVLNLARRIETKNLHQLFRWINSPDFNYDFDRDGKLNEEDYQTFKWLLHSPHLFKYLTRQGKKNLDLNRDGKLDIADVDEFNRLVELVERVNDPEFNLDFNGDGALDWEDYTLFKTFDGVEGDTPDFQKFLTEEAKRKLDLNHDGVVDPNDVVLFGKRLTQREKQIELVKQDLINTFGFGAKQLEALIEEGLIKFVRNERDPLSLTVVIDPSVKLRSDAVNLTDPLGSKDLPHEIRYRLGLLRSACAEGGVCASYVLTSANFTNSKGQMVKVGYHLGQLQSVKIYNPDYRDVVCIKAPCGILVKEIRYSHGGPGEFKAYITYHDGSQGEVASRRVYFEDGRIREVDELDKEGKVMARSIWVEWNSGCEPGQFCVMYYPPYFEPYIRREDTNGNLLSTVRVSDYYRLWEKYSKSGVREETPPPDIKLVTITLPDGTVVSQKFIHLTIEDILNFARKVEQENGLEKLRQEILDRVDDTIKRIEAEIAELQVKLEEIVAGIKQDASHLTQALKDIVGSLEAIIDEKGLSDETRQMIQEYLDAMAKYLNPENQGSFPQLVDLFIDDQYFWIGHVKIDSRRDYLKELDFYREAVQNAKTKEELEELAQHFPTFMEPVYKRRAVGDPRPEARKHLAHGEALLAKAREEIMTPQEVSKSETITEWGNGTVGTSEKPAANAFASYELLKN